MSEIGGLSGSNRGLQSAMALIRQDHAILNSGFKRGACLFSLIFT